MLAKKFYQGMKSHAAEIAIGGMLSGLLAISSASNQKTGSFVDTQASKRYEYVLSQRGDHKTLYVWDKYSSVSIFPLKLMDLNKDGIVDYSGIVAYMRLPIEFNELGNPRINQEYEERLQRLYNLAFEDIERKNYRLKGD